MDHQLPILLADSRFKLLACGRRWGKTAVGLIAVIEGHGSTRGRYRGALNGGRIWWVVPSYPHASEVWRNLKEAVKDAATTINEVERRVQLPGGGSVTIKSGDNPNSLRGFGLDGVVIDEAAFCDEDVWLRALRPAISDRRGWAMMLSSPNGFNWFHQLFDDAGTDGDWTVFQRPTSDNPLVSQKELDAARRQIGDAAYFQEYGGQFVSVSGAEFPAEYFDDDLIWVKEAPRSCYAKVVALDPSKGKHAKRGDFQASVYVGVWENVAYVDAVIDRYPIGQAVANTLKLAFRYGVQTIAYEANGFQEMIGGEFERQLAGNRLHGITVVPIENYGSKESRIQSLDPLLSNREIRFVDSPGTRLLVSQLREFPMATHDDGPDALEMAIRTALNLIHDADVAHPSRIDN
jgi:predicted phage terminase large subunit-like protein